MKDRVMVASSNTSHPSLKHSFDESDTGFSPFKPIKPST